MWDRSFGRPTAVLQLPSTPLSPCATGNRQKAVKGQSGTLTQHSNGQEEDSHPHSPGGENLQDEIFGPLPNSRPRGLATPSTGTSGKASKGRTRTHSGGQKDSLFGNISTMAKRLRYDKANFPSSQGSSDFSLNEIDSFTRFVLEEARHHDEAAEKYRAMSKRLESVREHVLEQVKGKRAAEDALKIFMKMQD